jgi:transcriptional regulator with XRE-family HTH domain
MPGSWQSSLLGFAGLLRYLRAEAKLTQEELAEAAGLSPRSVSDLERGINRTARKTSQHRLTDILLRWLSLTLSLAPGLAGIGEEALPPHVKVRLSRRASRPGGSDRATCRTLPALVVGVSLAVAAAACSSGQQQFGRRLGPFCPAPSTSAAASAAMSTLGTHSLPAFLAFYDAHEDVIVVSAVPCWGMNLGPAPSRGEGSSVAVTPGWRR